MNRRYKIIMLCGNSEFMEEFLIEQKKLTRAGNIVIGTASHDRTYENLSMSEEILLDDLIKRQIEIADEILIVNKHDKINDNTENNIRYAINCGKPIRYMEKHYERNKRTLLCSL